MKPSPSHLTALALAIGFAVTWWMVRPPSPVSAEPAGMSMNASRSPAAGSASGGQPPIARNSIEVTSAPAVATDTTTDMEREQMAALFAAEPALIDALEDATGAADPQVRNDAEQFLNSLEMPAPNPLISVE